MFLNHKKNARMYLKQWGYFRALHVLLYRNRLSIAEMNLKPDILAKACHLLLQKVCYVKGPMSTGD